MNLYNFVKEFPSEKADISYQLSFIWHEIQELLEAVSRFEWANAKLEWQQVIQCIAYFLVAVNTPAYIVNLLTPLQINYMTLALERAKEWDKARYYVEKRGFRWRLPGRCCRSTRHISPIMARLYPELAGVNWEIILRNVLVE